MKRKLITEDKKIKNNVKGTVYSLIIKNYIIMAIAAVVIWIIAIHFSQYLKNKAVEQPELSEFLDKIVAVKNDDYGSVDIKKYMGANGYIEVLDGEANMIYCSDNEKNNNYTKRSSWRI